MSSRCSSTPCSNWNTNADEDDDVALAVRMRLRDVRQLDQERELPKIIAETYSSIGRDSLGARSQKPQFQGKISKDNTK
ncbi:hypothetical protein NDU88_009139 [Pleurodeles waltl]|uniref:Uncharacterized protein n=1 Tax=Pleurodeles waltl TaxID=8319 RepID=A0AAV7PU37_PLEWA|nr:hypothetical protein NDU88_009139 [Pleurodeles waltl]